LFKWSYSTEAVLAVSVAKTATIVACDVLGCFTTMCFLVL